MVALLAALAMGAAALHAPAACPAPPVVVVVFDELPVTSLLNADQTINAARFPNFDRLARDTVWYRNATTVADNTLAAVPALLTGRRPGLVDPMPPGSGRNLFTLLAPTHRIHAVEPFTRLCPPGLCVRAHPARIPPLTGDTVQIGRLRASLQVVRSIASEAGRPPLYFIHLVFPHVPWQYVPTGHRYAVTGNMLPGIRRKTWGTDHFRLVQAMQRHLLQVGFADRILGEIVRRLRASGLWRPAMVVVAADHGMSIRAGQNRRRVGERTFPDIAGVPLFVKWPGLRAGSVSSAPARIIDILPTIAEVIGGAPGWTFDGERLGGVQDTGPLFVRNAAQHVLKSMPFAQLAIERAAVTRRWAELLPGGWRSVRSSGASDPLSGARVRRLPRATGRCGRAVIDDHGFARVRPASGVVPVFVQGRVTGTGRLRQRLAIAVDGRIRAVVRSYREDGATRFSGLVPRTTLPRGRHEVAVYCIRPGGELGLMGTAPRWVPGTRARVPGPS